MAAVCPFFVAKISRDLALRLASSLCFPRPHSKLKCRPSCSWLVRPRAVWPSWRCSAGSPGALRPSRCRRAATPPGNAPRASEWRSMKASACMPLGGSSMQRAPSRRQLLSGARGTVRRPRRACSRPRCARGSSATVTRRLQDRCNTRRGARVCLHTALHTTIWPEPARIDSKSIESLASVPWSE